ncbi:MAG TPA: amidophosphoribosyltransferase [Candidatus Levybacteria bacterium]|nr:amidophosphoribosyltransferase [Candidatus Levybacteria bacterium]
MEDRLRHKCGVFGVFGKGLDVSKITYFGLYALQHRGQESSGIAVSNGKKISSHKGAGLVAQIYTEQILKKLKGNIAIGHNRYSTSGGAHGAHTQPVCVKGDKMALAHNGNLPVLEKLENFLTAKGLKTQGHNDSELMHMAISYYLKKGESIENAVRLSFPLFTGSFCLLIMTKDKLVAVRDAFGIRPLSLGKTKEGYIVSSETCAIDTVSAEYLRDVNPGEMVVISQNGLRSYKLENASQKLDIFELVYFARPDSILLGKRVHNIRRRLGQELAREVKIDADVVIPVPDSAIPAAIGYAAASGIPFDFGLVKNRYIGRTFILPEQRLRENSVQMKLNPIHDIIDGKKVIVIDDSIVRGTTLRKLVELLKKTGAKEVHVLSSSPPVVYPDFYGIDTPDQKELIAFHKTIQQIQEYIGADSLHYLSYDGLIKATDLSEDLFCMSCFTGEYPIDIGENYKSIGVPKARGKGVRIKTKD